MMLTGTMYVNKHNSVRKVTTFLFSRSKFKILLTYFYVTQAKETLKNLRVKVEHNRKEFKIIGFTDQPCCQQMYGICICSCIAFSLLCFIFVVMKLIALIFIVCKGKFIVKMVRLKSLILLLRIILK